MKARVLILIVCMSLVTAAALAHEGEEHILGTVTKVAQDSITVKKRENAVVTVAVVPATIFTKDKVSAKIADLKVGDRVVIHAKESGGKLVADIVQFVSVAKPTQPKQQTSAAPAAKQASNK